MKVVQKLVAPNDRNGNPRRLWVVYQVGKKQEATYVEIVIDDGYRGRPDEAMNIPELSNIDISSGTYEEWIRYAKGHGIWVAS